MLTISIRNVEEIVFLDKHVQRLFPEFADLFRTWALSRMDPTLRGVGKKALIDFLEALNDGHVRKLSAHLGTDLKIATTESRLVKNEVLPLDSADEDWREVIGWNYVVWRDATKLHVTKWR